MQDEIKQAAQADKLTPQAVFFKTTQRKRFEISQEEVLFELTRAHPLLLEELAAKHNCSNTRSTSELLGVLKTLCAITKAVRNRSYVIAAAVTSESGRLSASIAQTLASNVVLDSCIVCDCLEVVEITWHDGNAQIMSGWIDTEKEREAALWPTVKAQCVATGLTPLEALYSLWSDGAQGRSQAAWAAFTKGLETLSAVQIQQRLATQGIEIALDAAADLQVEVVAKGPSGVLAVKE